MTALVNMLVYIYIYIYSLDFVLYDFYIRLCLYRFLFELSNIRAKLCRVIFTLRYGKISVQERNARNCNFFFCFLGFLFGNILEESGPFQLHMKEKEILNSCI